MAIVVSSVALGGGGEGEWRKGGRVGTDRRADVGVRAVKRRTFEVDAEKRRTE